MFRISSICGSGGEKETAYDIFEVSTVSIGRYNWSGTADHSKWACAEYHKQEVTDDDPSSTNNQYYYYYYANRTTQDPSAKRGDNVNSVGNAYNISISNNSTVVCVGKYLSLSYKY